MNDYSSTCMPMSTHISPAPTLASLSEGLTTLWRQRQEATHALTVEIAQAQAHLKSLEIARENVAAPYTFAIETHQAALRALMLEQGVPQVKTSVFACARTERVQWDDAGLQAYAVEQPSVLQFRQVVEGTTWRWK